jgi:hypothetical protein
MDFCTQLTLLMYRVCICCLSCRRSFGCSGGIGSREIGYIGELVRTSRERAVESGNLLIEGGQSGFVFFVVDVRPIALPARVAMTAVAIPRCLPETFKNSSILNLS